MKLRVYVEEILLNGAKFRFSVIFGLEKNEGDYIAAELLEYKPDDKQEYFMVFPKAAQMSVDERLLMRGTFTESFVDKEGEFVFDFPTAKVFRMRSEVWLKAECLHMIESRKGMLKGIQHENNHM